MEFKELIEARRSVRKYVASEISKAEVEAIVGEAWNRCAVRGDFCYTIGVRLKV